MLVTMACAFPTVCWFAVNIQNVGNDVQTNVYSPEPVITYKDRANSYWDLFYRGWQARPDKPDFLDRTLVALLLNVAEFGIDVQIETLNDIRHGVYTDENLYTDVERDRTETIGFKPIWSPGGFQV